MGAETMRRAQAVHPIADLQIEYSLISRGVEEKILPVLNELGIGMTANGVLSRGLLSGSKPAATGDFRAALPRFQQGNEAVIRVLGEMAAERGVTASQLAIAWVMAKSEGVVSVVGARRRDQLAEMMGALEVTLTTDAVVRLEAALPMAEGSRYDAHQMAMLDSER